ncbi:MAG: hypothetical protein KKB20_02335 [Proteobacteria bacterium]|nr:hypothetical protein [Pseudomonadota bacterium]
MDDTRLKHEGNPRYGTSLKVLRYIGYALAGVAFAALIALIFGFLVKWLWNWLMPAVFGLGMITYWQAFGLVILARIFFHGIEPGRHDRFHNKVRGHGEWGTYHNRDSSQESNRHHPFDRWKLYDRFWKDEGRAAFDAFMDRIEKERTPETDDTTG